VRLHACTFKLERVSSAARSMEARNVLYDGLAKCAISIPDLSISPALALGAERGEIPIWLIREDYYSRDHYVTYSRVCTSWSVRNFVKYVSLKSTTIDKVLS